MSINPLALAPVVTNTSPAGFPGPEPLIGQHVILERLAEKHFPDLWENIGSHPDPWTWWPDEPPSSTEYFNELLHISPDVVVYAILPVSGPNKGNALGLAFAQSEHRETHRVAELGLLFGPQLQRTRVGTEAVYLLADWMFKLNHRRLAWKTNALNVASRKAAERYGFVFEGVFRQEQINKGRNRDTAWYSIIDSEWPLCSQAFAKWLEDGNFDEQQRQRRSVVEIRESLKHSS